MNKKHIGSVMTAFGLIMCLGAAGLTGYNILEDKRAGEAVSSVLEKIEQSAGNAFNAAAANTADDSETAEDEAHADMPDPDMEMPVMEIDGYNYIGVLEIPALGLELPVMEEWDYTRMKTAPCRYSGSVYRNDLIIAAHNYSSHFGNLQDLNFGDTILFTDMNGNRFEYQAVMTEMLDGMAVDEMKNNPWDLTLFTCTLSGQARVTVRCAAVSE